MKLTKEEKELIERRREEEDRAKADADFIDAYDRSHCEDEWGNWK